MTLVKILTLLTNQREDIYNIFIAVPEVMAERVEGEKF